MTVTDAPVEQQHKLVLLKLAERTLQDKSQLGISDPRQVAAICLCGRDMLLDGSYQQMLASTANAGEAF